MGIYYYLVNDDTNEILSLDAHLKEGPHRFNQAVHMAYINYMLEHVGDTMRLLEDNSGEFDECLEDEYTEIDLLKYAFENDEVMPKIVALLNQIYETDRYIVKNGVGAFRPLKDKANEG